MRLLRMTIAALPFALGACATTLPAGITATGAGFGLVADKTQGATGRRTVWVQNAAQAREVAESVHAMTHRRTISADTAVQVALLNNRGLQASYADIGISAAEVWQQATPENPIVSVGLLGIGAPELGLFRALESVVAVNLLDAPTRKRRVAVAQADYQRAQMQAVVDTLTLAAQTRTAWIDAVAAFETVVLLNQAASAADASSELAARLGRTGCAEPGGTGARAGLRRRTGRAGGRGASGRGLRQGAAHADDGTLGNGGRLLRARCPAVPARAV